MDIKRKVRDRRQPGFFTIDNEVYDLGLSCESLALYSAIARFANNSTESAYFSGKKWKKHHKVGHAKLSAAMRELTAHKLIFDTGEKTLVGASYFELCNIDHLKKQKGGEVFQGRTGGYPEVEQGGVLRQNTNETNKTKQENDTLSAADFIKSPFEQEKKKTKIRKPVKTLNIPEIESLLKIVVSNGMKETAISSNLKMQMLHAIELHGEEFCVAAIKGRIIQARQKGQNLALGRFFDPENGEWMGDCAKLGTEPTVQAGGNSGEMFKKYDTMTDADVEHFEKILAG